MNTKGGSKRITVLDFQDALKFFIYFDKNQRLVLMKCFQLVTKKVKMKLINLNLEYKIVVLHGRVKKFPIGFRSNEEILVLPCSKLAKLIVKYHHNRIHRDIDTVVSVVCNKFLANQSKKVDR